MNLIERREDGLSIFIRKVSTLENLEVGTLTAVYLSLSPSPSLAVGPWPTLMVVHWHPPGQRLTQAQKHTPSRPSDLLEAGSAGSGPCSWLFLDICRCVCSPPPASTVQLSTLSTTAYLLSMPTLLYMYLSPSSSSPEPRTLGVGRRSSAAVELQWCGDSMQQET